MYKFSVCITAGQTSNLVSFQAGNVNDEYRATAVVRITDIFGDYVDIRYRVKVSVIYFSLFINEND